MKKFLVPIDFSETAKNAASYALQLTKGIPEAEIKFYHVFSSISLATLTSKDEGSRYQVSLQALEEIKKELAGASVTNIECVVEEGNFIENITDYVLGNHVDMVVMGITGSSRIKQVFMGTNTLNVIRHISCPVMIIPPEARFKGIEKAILTSDFKDVARTTPFAALKEILDTFKPQLNITNVDSEHFVELTDEYKIERATMEDKLNQYNPEFSFLRTYDFLEGINNFVEMKSIDVIITIPRKHSFLSQLFKTSHTKKLAYHSTVPTIAIPS